MELRNYTEGLLDRYFTETLFGLPMLDVLLKVRDVDN